jgi:hypothetical protein
MQVSETVCKQGNRRGRFRLGSDRDDAAFSMPENGSGHRVHPLSMSAVSQDSGRSLCVAETFRKVPDISRLGLSIPAGCLEKPESASNGAFLYADGSDRTDVIWWVNMQCAQPCFVHGVAAVARAAW